MKFKIICVVIIAAAFSAILGMALLQKDDAAPATSQPAATTSAPVASVDPVAPVAPVAPVPAEPAVPAAAPTEAAIDTANPPPAPLDQQQRREMTDVSLIPATGKEMRMMLSDKKEKPKVFETALADPGLFGRLSSGQKVNVISNALNLNEEQEVMLASYLENWHSLQAEYAGRPLISMSRPGQGPQAGPSSSSMSASATIHLDTKLSELEIAVQEMKEVKGLRDVFYEALTKQQKEKFDALAIKSVF